MPRGKQAAPKHRQIFDALSREIAGERYQPGEKFPSEAALVRRFNVSRITVGRAVRDLVDHGLVERFAGSGTYVADRRDAQGRHFTFGLIIPDLGATEIFEPICQGIATAPEAQGHALLWPNSRDPDREQQALQLCRQCISRQVSGVFFAPIEMTPRAGEINRQIVAELREARIPIVFLDRRPSETVPRDRSDLVSIDNQRAGFLATDHLLRHGTRHIAFVSWHGQASSVVGRIAGYRRAIDNTPGDVIEIASPDRFELPPRAARFDGFVCANDRIAGHLMRALLTQGRTIPRDARIVGIDDVTYASLLPVPLTTIHQPCHEIGETALGMLLDRITHPRMPSRDVLLDCDLVIRQSCGSA
jgi:DNA-binding LacI/PurR family transcriptional regulator